MGQPYLLESHRGGGGANRPRDFKARATELALPDAVLVAVVGQGFEVEHLAQGQAHITYGDLVEGDADIMDWAGRYLAHRVIDRYRRHVALVQPPGGVQSEAGLVTHESGAVALEEPFYAAGAHHQDVACLVLHPLLFLGG